MAPALRHLTCTTLCALLLFATPAPAQSGKTILIPADKLDCFLEHQEKYLSVPRAVVSFTPAYCPALTRSEVIAAARAAQNSGGSVGGKSNQGVQSTVIQRNLLNKKRLRCMFEQIAAYRKENPLPEETETPEGTSETASAEIQPRERNLAEARIIEISLDCP